MIEDRKFDLAKATRIDGEEVAKRLKGILKSLGVQMFITGASVSAIFPDGSAAYYVPVNMDTET